MEMEIRTYPVVVRCKTLSHFGRGKAAEQRETFGFERLERPHQAWAIAPAALALLSPPAPRWKVPNVPNMPNMPCMPKMPEMLHVSA
jgi:hypothetical protein